MINETITLTHFFRLYPHDTFEPTGTTTNSKPMGTTQSDHNGTKDSDRTNIHFARSLHPVTPNNN